MYARRRRGLPLAGLALVLCAPAPPLLAQEAERKFFYDFSDDVVEADLSRPDGAYQSLGTGRMKRANRLAGEILQRRMRRSRPTDMKLIRRAGAADVVVVSGGYDRVQDVLRAVKIKHVVIPPRLVAKVPLMSLQTVMVNCPGRMSRAAEKRLGRFVRTGGFLVTTDWALSLVQRTFPRTIARGGRNTKDDVVAVQITKSAGGLVSQARAMKASPRWWLEGASYPIRVLDPKRVKVLISSREMKRKYGHAPIAVAFRWHDGQVMHLTSHFYLQQSKLKTAAERARGSAFARSAGLSGADLEALRRQGLDQVAAGSLNSAYAMQQVTTNLLVSKARENRVLIMNHPWRAARSFTLRAGPAAGAAPLPGGQVKAGFLLRVIRRAGKWVLVRDLLARQGWTGAGNIEKR